MTTVFTLAAQEKAAMHRTQLLLAHCRSCRPPSAPMAYAQARWHAQQQTDFLAWLDAGGFAQVHADQSERLEAAVEMRSTIENSGMAPLFSAP
jgi:hypothetical protein